MTNGGCWCGSENCSIVIEGHEKLPNTTSTGGASFCSHQYVHENLDLGKN